jgi:hypothetical protein
MAASWPFWQHWWLLGAGAGTVGASWWHPAGWSEAWPVVGHPCAAKGAASTAAISRNAKALKEDCRIAERRIFKSGIAKSGIAKSGITKS